MGKGISKDTQVKIKLYNSQLSRSNTQSKAFVNNGMLRHGWLQRKCSGKVHGK